MTLTRGKKNCFWESELRTKFCFSQNIPSRTGALTHEIKDQPKDEEDWMTFFFVQKQIKNNKQDYHSAMFRVASRWSENDLFAFGTWMNAKLSTSSLPAICCSHHRWSSSCQNKLELDTVSNQQIQRVHPSLSGLDRWPNMGTDCSSQDVIGVRKWAENNIADPLCHEYNLSPQAVSAARRFYSPKHQTREGTASS